MEAMAKALAADAALEQLTEIVSLVVFLTETAIIANFICIHGSSIKTDS